MELSNIEPQDAGDFVCQISLKAGETLEIAHTVEVLGKVKLLQSICGPKICIKYSKHRRSDDTAFGARTFSWQDPVHSWKAGPGKVMIVKNL